MTGPVFEPPPPDDPLARDLARELDGLERRVRAYQPSLRREHLAIALLFLGLLGLGLHGWHRAAHEVRHCASAPLECSDGGKVEARR